MAKIKNGTKVKYNGCNVDPQHNDQRLTVGQIYTAQDYDDNLEVFNLEEFPPKDGWDIDSWFFGEDFEVV